MKRRNALKRLGALGIAGMAAPAAQSHAAELLSQKQTGSWDSSRRGCWLTPSETEGPYYFNANLIREDIRTDVDTGEFHDGIPLRMHITVIGEDCTPLPNLLVDVWHADKDGVYSGYVQPGGNTVGEDFMRGIQITDGSGQCTFLTSYPGWYPGRATHIHFKIRIDTTTYVTSQWAFLDEVNDLIYETPLYSDRGSNPTTNGQDGIFGSDEPQYQVMDVVYNEDTGEYDGFYTIGVDAPTTSVDDGFPQETAGILQNRPNPFKTSTTIAYQLPESGPVRLTVYDVMGRRVATLAEGQRSAGIHEVQFDAGDLENGYYLAKLVAAGQTSTREVLLLR